MFQRVLLCYDGTEAGRRALKRGAELAIFLKSRVYVLSIVPPSEFDPGVMAGAAGHACLVDCRMTDHQRQMEESISWLRARGTDAQGFLTSGNIVDEIAAHVGRLNIDLIVLGHYPQPSGGMWWTRGARSTLAERTRCCILVANERGLPADPA